MGKEQFEKLLNMTRSSIDLLSPICAKLRQAIRVAST
jgi:hypothetical protein